MASYCYRDWILSELPRYHFRHTSVRDPLYGFVDLSKAETDILDTQILRRLHSIKQLSHAHVVYPSAIHTRLEHSLGCLYVANKMCHELEIRGEDLENVRMAALLHDIGHGPFSHLFERVIEKINPNLSKPHETITAIMIRESEELGSIIDSKRDVITNLLNPENTTPLSDNKTSLLSDIVTSGLDADKLDYLRRDSYHIGVAYGQFDLDRILHTLGKTPHKQTHICIDIKGKDALENYRLGRYLMHAQVYEHHKRLAADQMFLRALDIAVEEGVMDRADLTVCSNSTNRKFLEFYLTLDDNSIYETILKSDKSETSKEILTNIKQRRLLKRACEFTPQSLKGHADIGNELSLMDENHLCRMSSEVAQELGMQDHEIIFHKSKIDIKLFKEGEILVQQNGMVLDFQASSPITAKDSIIKFYVYGPEDAEKRRKISKKMADRLGVPVEQISKIK